VSGGFIGAQIKYAGYDGFLITGKADKPTYLFVEDGKVEFRSAEKLWGKLTGETQEMIKEEVGDPNLCVSAIGPAGENLVRYACVITEYRAAGRGGVGAVLGSKKLKAIAVRGSGTNEVADPEAYEAWMQWYKEEAKKVPGIAVGLPTYGTPALVASIGKMLGAMGSYNHQTEFFQNWENISGERLKKEFWDKDTACPDGKGFRSYRKVPADPFLQRADFLLGDAELCGADRTKTGPFFGKALHFRGGGPAARGF
ncbi:MAG: aldehyde ferredoxin oxidoreductase N-terminal domain-containing protein, partial [Desulfotomaculales bacterium]